ncbi:L-2-hydroxyglutarate oxidase [Phytoactinopolyspora limicola]|uniref:L-2-hydroxyglutarate oxidase n=1 Tax=Phytoactinopolyspora limicola TaxID=2715536 RepID=UPI00140BE69F|nr:L-2-hydroxyglutarate oxidase [Phytoactinopolyspora limicola]
MTSSAAPAGRRYAVIGAGIVGAAVARALTQRHPGCQVTILEKETGPAEHQSGRNSGVVHAGLYYQPGSAKARLVRRGIRMLQQYCQERDLPYVECGKVLIARNERDLDRLKDIEARATANGVSKVRLIDHDELRTIEPHAAGIAALHSPTTAIVDYPAVTRELLQDTVDAGGRVHTGVTVTGFDQQRSSEVVIKGLHDGTEADLGAFDHVVVCAGLHADTLAVLAGHDPFPRIVPFRGEFAALVPHRRALVNGLIYPVPDPRYPFLGVHLTPRVDGEVFIGPNAVLATAREGYRRRDVDLGALRTLVGWRGFRRFARQNWRAGLREMYGSASRRAFVRGARHYVPELTVRDVTAAPAGIRAQAMNADGSLVDDFRTSRRDRIFVVRNAPSPAATASLAIADDILAELDEGPRD